MLIKTLYLEYKMNYYKPIKDIQAAIQMGKKLEQIYHKRGREDVQMANKHGKEHLRIFLPFTQCFCQNYHP
jgi:hypothetical protein